MTQAANLAAVGSTLTPDSSGNVSITGKKYQAGGVTTNALAWVNFNGSTAAIRSAYNVGSITKNGTGDYTVNITNATTDANYSVQLLWGNGSTKDWNGFATLGASTTTTTRVFTSNNAGTAFDAAYLCLAIFGN